MLDNRSAQSINSFVHFELRVRCNQSSDLSSLPLSTAYAHSTFLALELDVVNNKSYLQGIVSALESQNLADPR